MFLKSSFSYYFHHQRAASDKAGTGIKAQGKVLESVGNFLYGARWEFYRIRKPNVKISHRVNDAAFLLSPAI